MKEIDALIDQIRATPATSGFVLDFDGTLSDIAEEAGEARPLPGAGELLEDLAGRYRVVALLTGRPARRLREIVGAAGPVYLGIYGAEELVGDELRRPPEADLWLSLASRIARDAEVLIKTTGLSGCTVEYKELAVSVHYRQATDGHAGDAIFEWAVSAAAKKRFVATKGRKVVEIVPEGVSKQIALRSVVESYELQSVVAAGDDSADVHALEEAGRLLGPRALRIGLSSEEEPDGLRENSDLVLESPGDLFELLRRF